jgi:hypothetical protein
VERADDPGGDPASYGATWPRAVAEATTNSAPVPAAATDTPATTVAGWIASAGGAIPAAATIRPITASGRAPSLPMARPVRFAPAIVASATRRNSSPVRMAPYPRTRRCRAPRRLGRCGRPHGWSALRRTRCRGRGHRLVSPRIGAAPPCTGSARRRSRPSDGRPRGSVPRPDRTDRRFRAPGRGTGTAIASILSAEVTFLTIRASRTSERRRRRAARRAAQRWRHPPHLHAE